MRFLWHDYETFGTQPAVDRPCQFAAQRTDAGLNPVGEEVVLYCAPANDTLPRPAACLITGITPQEARRRGRNEAEFARQVRSLMIEPGTCCAGYNSLRFDDEVTRNLFYRNLLDPYEREWKNGNSRWDLINLVRMCYALRPEGVEWPMVETADSDGDLTAPPAGGGLRPSFRLEDLARANGIAHQDAHDAGADVRATIALARLIRAAQPRLFEWALTLRDRQQARRLLDFADPKPVVHTSGRFPSTRGCTTLVLPLAPHPQNDRAVIVFDLMGDPGALLDGDPGSIRDRVFTPTADLPEGVTRLPLKAVKWNAVPMLAPANVLAGVDTDRIGLDPDRCNTTAERLLRHLGTVRQKVEDAFRTDFGDGPPDPDLALYSGGFFSDTDRDLMTRIHQSDPAKLSQQNWPFSDPRLPLMLLRYRARNWPDSLSQAEWEAWDEDRKRRLASPVGEPFYGLEAFRADLAEARGRHAGDARAVRILDELESWSIELELED